VDKQVEKGCNQTVTLAEEGCPQIDQCRLNIWPARERRHRFRLLFRMDDEQNDDLDEPITPYDNVLYLMNELEAALDRRTVDWPPGALDDARQRAIRILGALVTITP
jgi:hypothetical protein